MHRVTVLAALIAVALVVVLASASSQAATQGRWVITSLDSRSSEALAINDRGQIVGDVYESGGWHAWLWQDGRSEVRVLHATFGSPVVDSVLAEPASRRSCLEVEMLSRS